MQYLKITQCQDSQMWYASKVGQCVPFVAKFDDCFMSREDAGFSNIVRLTDAHIVECCNGNCEQGRLCPLK